MFETALKKDELVTAVEFTIPEKSAYKNTSSISLCACGSIFKI